MNKITFCLLALLLYAAPLVSVSHGQIQSTTLSSRQEAWVESVVPKIKTAAEGQQEVLMRAFKLVANDIAQTKSKAGIEKFIAEATSLRSKGMRLTDPAGHRRWLRQLFEKHVIPVSTIRTIIETRSKFVDQSLAELDNKLIVDLRADVALDPSSIRCRPIDAGVINREIDKVASQVYATVDEATAKSIASFFAGTVGFEAGRRLSRSAMADERGKVSLFGEILSFGLGMVADEVTSQVTNEVLGTKSEMRKSLNTLADRVIAGCIGEGKVAQAIVSEYTGSVRAHQSAVINALLKNLGLDPKWALQQF